MRFTKMQGLGNDYVYLDCTKGPVSDLPELARRMSDRHFGIGSDGLICIFPSDIADFKMVMFNADGSQAEMCGNGIRCVGKYIHDKGLSDKLELAIETLAGVKYLTLILLGGQVDAVTVDMGVPQLDKPLAVTAQNKEYQLFPVSMGNPHAIHFAAGVKDLDLTGIGPILEHDSHFPHRTNVEFVQVLSRDHVLMRVWERGSGETLACGTGACATVAACVAQGLTGREVTVTLLGGDLHLRWDEHDGHIYMTGPARTVFEGEWPEIMVL